MPEYRNDFRADKTRSPLALIVESSRGPSQPSAAEDAPGAAHGDATRFLNGRLKMRQLLLLIALDDHRNIHRAAEEVHMTQPSASKQILELEANLGVKLFERLPRGMEPTIFGETMIRHARKALSSLALAHGDVMALRSGLIGQIEIGTIAPGVMTVLPKAIAQVKKQAPTLTVNVHVETSKVLLQRLRDGTLDFMIGRLHGDGEGLVYERLADERLCVIARSGHPLLQRTAVHLVDVVDAPWILAPKGSILRTRFDGMFRMDGLAPPSDVVESSSVPLILCLLQEMDGLHVMPREMAEYYASLGVVGIVPLDMPCRMDAFGLIRKEDHLLSPCAALLLGALRKLAREHGWAGASAPHPATSALPAPAKLDALCG